MGSETRNLFDLTGKVAVVTGGNRGIGLGMARGLARSGAAISVWARDEARNESAAEELAMLGAEVQTIGCDVSSERAVEYWKAGQRYPENAKMVLMGLDALLRRRRIPKQRRYAPGARKRGSAQGLERRHTYPGRA